MERFCVADFRKKALKKISGVEVSVITASAESTTDVENNAKELNKGIFKALKFPAWQAAFEDILEAWWVVLIAMIMAFALGYLYIVLMKYCARVIMYVMIVCFYVGLAVIGFLFWNYGDSLSDGKDIKQTTNPDYYKWAAYGIWGIEAILLILLFCSCKSIETAINMLQVGATFIQNNGCVVFLPIIWVTAYIVF